MRVSILKYVFFSIIICFFEYAQNEICHERNIIKFRSNRILGDVENQFDLNDFYESTLNLVNQLNDYDDDEEMMFLRNTIDSHIKEHKENNTLPDLNNVDKKTKKIIRKLQKELEEVKKELDNKRNNEIAIQPKKNKKIKKKEENNSVSNDEDSTELENEGNSLKAKNNRIVKKIIRHVLMKAMVFWGVIIIILVSGKLLIPFIVLITLISADSVIKIKKITKFKMPKLFK
ncbi:fam-b protein [Plasmodium yoelii]|uniref:Fam-b protein n=3 Tax=Plasmodium yoelii TaxID=5861 RepID=A0AAF0B1I7_PLAYO|nr:fam-b protein [Plasmodium yoelii]EAA18818.1 hypothetical protein [Plasmodium yoelii yoelii]WBY56503.1 fam-b protein [Plasmodium yoelii yoelii]CDS44033.1 fam-b protein [Plasmodium yoelii]VTZ77008.1 fam-b protein [Plasmodium yoelii]|eukprot:XP_731409.2 fam-b protein [Plasmodium yoelii]